MSDGQEAPKLIMVDGVEYVSTTALQEIERRLYTLEVQSGKIDAGKIEEHISRVVADIYGDIDSKPDPTRYHVIPNDPNQRAYTVEKPKSDTSADLAQE